MTVSVLVPSGGAECEHRERAREYVLAHYRREHPAWELIEGRCAEPWSKGAAVQDAYERATGDLLVLADADSFISPQGLILAVGAINAGFAAWAVPHLRVYRLSEAETGRVFDGGRPRLGHVVRTPYTGPPGGGITVLTRAAYEAVNGIDPRFLGWGGEDLSFGWALETLCGPHWRGEADFIHLWHPHPAPDLRGSLESEALVAQYKSARCIPGRMRRLVGTDPEPKSALAEPARFRLADPSRRLVKLGGEAIQFPLETLDPDLAEALRVHPMVRELIR